MTSLSPTSLDGLNVAQAEAVRHFEGPILVLAGAGSGKTRVLTTRIARLIELHGVRPDQILSVTFTNKAAGEMRNRVGRLLGQDPAGMWIGTFHAIGARLLRRSAHLVGRTASFTIYDEDDTLGALKRLMERIGISPKEFPPKAVLASISDAKNALVSPDEFAGLARDPFSRAVAAVYDKFEGALRQCNAVTFDDLLVLPVRILREDPALLATLRERFRHVLVDEYQDTNRAQYQLIKMLGGEHGNVMVVGDDDQSIYGWRGADIRNILDFEKDFPNATLVRLEENYRSTPRILDLANIVIAANTERRGKTLRATQPDGDKVSLMVAADERDEADAIADEILKRRSGAARVMLRDVAILYRTNAQSRALEESMRKRSIPYRLVGAVRFYDRREIRDLMGYLKLIANPADDEAFRRAISAPKRGLGDTSIDTLAAAADAAAIPLLEAARRPELVATLRPAARTALADFSALIHRFREQAKDSGVDELLRDLIDAIGYATFLRNEGPEGIERLDNVRELVAGAAETVADEGGEVGLTPLDHFLQRATLVAGIDGLDPDADAITMMTMHNAKGLEFPIVFISGLEDGLFPLARAYDDPAMLQEERRLFYVGITRAERKLILSYAEQRRRNGELLPGRPSSFLARIPRDRLDQTRTVKARSTGRSAFMERDAEWGGSSYNRSASWGSAPASGAPARAGSGPAVSDASWGAERAAGGRKLGSAPEVPQRGVEDESQDAAVIAVGARVRHRKFGGGTIAELSGSGRDLKARIDFDDEEIGRKTLVVAQANLEREWE